MHDLHLERFLKDEPGDGPIKTFTLRGIKDSPPYLHDGRCLTLEDTVEFFNLVLGLKLTAQEKTDLVAFMRAVVNEAGVCCARGKACRLEAPPFPSLQRRGGVAKRNSMARSHILSAPGWSLTINVQCERPPRLRLWRRNPSFARREIRVFYSAESRLSPV